MVGALRTGVVVAWREFVRSGTAGADQDASLDDRAFLRKIQSGRSSSGCRASKQHNNRQLVIRDSQSEQNLATGCAKGAVAKN